MTEKELLKRKLLGEKFKYLLDDFSKFCHVLFLVDNRGRRRGLYMHDFSDKDFYVYLDSWGNFISNFESDILTVESGTYSAPSYEIGCIRLLEYFSDIKDCHYEVCSFGALNGVYIKAKSKNTVIVSDIRLNLVRFKHHITKVRL